MGRRDNRRGRVTAVINVREILRLHAAGFNQTQIAQSCNISRSTVQDYLHRAAAAELSYEAARNLEDSELLSKLGKGKERKARKELAVDFHQIAKELEHKGVTLELLWHEHVVEQGIAVSYSTFCRRFRHWSKTSSYSMRQHYPPGDKLFVDYAGATLSYLPDRSGEMREAQVFVSCLGASSKTFVDVTPDQTVSSWIGSHCRALNFYGGVPQAIVPDNLKSGVTDPWWYEPELNRSYQDFAEYYDTAILPARVRKPRDKAKVEKAVQEVERWILAPLRRRVFGSIAEINEAIKPLLAALNAKKMRHYAASRSELFEQAERKALKPLPPKPYQIAVWKKVRVNVDYHVEFERHYYSVPYFYARQQAWLKAGEKLIEVFINNQRVAFHQRSSEQYSHTTLPEHMPPEHKAVKSWTAEKFLSWSTSIGTETEKLVQAIFASRAHKEQAFRAVLGLQRLADKHTAERLEAAAARANYFKLTQVRNLRSILEKGLERMPLSVPVDEAPVVTHGNLRGPTVFH